jgi:hypothetical protein
MPLTEGTLSISGSVFDMTGVGAYVGGTNLGKVTTEPTQSRIVRDVELWSKQTTGSTPVFGSSSGEHIELAMVLSDYNADTLSIWSQKHQASGAVQNYHFGLSDYKLGHFYDSTELFPLMIRDDTLASDRPALYLPACAVVDLGEELWSRSKKHQEEKQIIIVALYDETLGTPALYGDSAEFPDLGGGGGED